MPETVKPTSNAARYLRNAALTAGLALPTLTLVPFGSIWLWQNGYLLHWAAVTAMLVIGANLFARHLTRSTLAPPKTAGRDDAADPAWSTLEDLAWADVIDLAQRTEASRLTSREAFVDLGAETIGVVAKRLHPEMPEPLWQFTVPEAFAMSERVSRRLGAFVAENIPLGDQLTVAQAMSLYRWKGAVDIAEKAYDVWRLLRLMNPVTAATHELRERFSKQIMQWGREHVTQRVAHAYVREVGRAAIDLYGGRLRVPAHRLENEVSASTRADTATIAGRIAEPLRILVAGRKGAGKSLLIRALAAKSTHVVAPAAKKGDYDVAPLQRQGFPNSLLIEGTGYGSDAAKTDSKVIKSALDCDLIVWVTAADQPDPAADLRIANAVRAEYAKRPSRPMPPSVVVSTRFGQAPDTENIGASAADFAAAVGVDRHDFVAADLFAEAIDFEPLWTEMQKVVAKAERARLSRRTEETNSRWNLRRVLAQATNAGRVIGRNIK